MSIPSSVEAVLNEHQINYGLTETPQFGDYSFSQFIKQAGITRTTLLGDAKGQIQVITPADSMLDLNAVIKYTGRELRALPESELANIINDKQLCSLPAIPQLTGLPTLLDEAVLRQPEIVLESGGNTGLLRLKQQDFKLIVNDAIVGDFSTTIPPMVYANEAEDIDLISNAVGKFTSKRIQTRLEDTLEFPPLPDTAQRIIKLRVDTNADIKDLSDIVEVDPSLAAQVVSWASSPYYAAPGKIKSVHDAIVRVLGFDLVMNLALGLALGKTLKMPSDAPQGFIGFWHQSVYTAAVVEELVKAIPPKSRPELGLACLSGLLHNFGYLLLAEVFPPYFSLICRYQEANRHIGHSAITRQLIGIDREQMAAWLMNLWAMPDEVCTALRYQNDPHYDGPHHQYANLLYVASRLLKLHGVGDCTLEAVPAEVYKRLNLEPELAVNASENVVACAEEINELAKDLSN